MNLAPLSFRFPTLTLLALLLLTAGCVKAPHPTEPVSPSAQEQQPACLDQEKNSLPADALIEPGQDNHTATCPDARTIQESERNRASCYHLQPGATVVHTKGHHSTKHAATATKKKGLKTTSAVAATKQKKGQQTSATKTLATKKKGKQKTGQAATTPPTEEVRTTTGMCQPQSLIYARCRTGIKTCSMGNTSPVQWFACAKKNKATTAVPTAGSVLVLDGNSGRKMSTGHPVYVEAVSANKNGTWTLRITHTNYDRKCHLDLDAIVLFDPKHMTASFQSGPWSTWAKDLKALGFILQ